MKTRNGFVSNSSSSSFVVWFPQPIKSRDDLERAIFPKGKHDIHGYWSEDVISADQCLDELWDQVQNPDTWRIKEILEHHPHTGDEVFDEQQLAIEKIKQEKYIVAAYSGTLRKTKLTDDHWYGSKIYNYYSRHINDIETEMIRRLQSSSSNVPYSFEFEDHNHVTRVLENGDQFDHLKHHKESHH